ncbi:hypothetical protein Avbf_18239, partial [Armadillidium vulgare]
MSNPKRSYNFLRIKTVELAPFGNIEIDGDKYPQDLSYSVSTVYCETPEEKWNPSPDIHLVILSRMRVGLILKQFHETWYTLLFNEAEQIRG